MSTCNYRHDALLGIIALNFYDFEDEYRADEGIEPEEDISYIREWYFEDCSEEIRELNSKLNYLSLELEPGYYEGASLKIEGNGIDTDDLQHVLAARHNKNELTAVCRDIEWNYYYYCKPSELFAEYKTVVDWINYGIKSNALLHLGVSAVFSNGEAIYHKNNSLLEV